MRMRTEIVLATMARSVTDANSKKPPLTIGVGSRCLGQGGINIEFKDVYYLIEWWGMTSFGEPFTDSEWFKDEDEAESFIAYDLANDPLVRGAIFTTHKTVAFKREK